MTTVSGKSVIDSHLHIWKLGQGRYSWLKPELGFLYQDFTIESAQKELSEAGISQAILVQADDNLEDTNALLEAAAENDWVAGVVGWVPFEEPNGVEEYLSKLSTATKIVGFRQLIHDDSRFGLVSSDLFIKSLKLIAASGFVFDVPDAWPKNLGSIPKLAREVPSLKIVIDHLGKPPAERDDYPSWRAEFVKSADHENVFVKLSGLVNAAEEYRVSSLQRIFHEALENFGADRILFGGDWPVSNVDGRYAPMVSVLFDLIGTLSKAEQQLIFSTNAISVYRLRQINDQQKGT